MNRLVLIGNGFDLAHDLKTSYGDFLNWYLKNVLNEFFDKKVYSDKLLEFKSEYFFDSLPQIDSIEKAIEIINILKSKQNSDLSIKFISPFFQEIIDLFHHKNWVDLENHYFSYLKRIIKSTNYDRKQISILNDHFEFIKTKFIEYLNIVIADRPLFNPSKFHFLLDNVDDSHLIDKNPEYPKAIENVYVVNFNYTNTFETYANYLNRKINIQTNHIHGELNCPENPIIFGFGDEHDDDYKGFENKNNNELFQHIKSFNYLKTSNYQDLIRFIYASEFQVCIMGHSCGLSDRTMLKEIFEHDNCKSILIYYHKWGNDINQNDYVEKTYEISRHFTDKGTMRKKVVSFDKSKHL